MQFNTNTTFKKYSVRAMSGSVRERGGGGGGGGICLTAWRRVREMQAETRKGKREGD